MYEYKDIRNVHLEPTEKCQAVCPMCPRNILGGKENPFVINAELTLDDCKQIFEPKFIKQLDTMYMCGNYGDPILAKDTAEIMLYFRKSNPDMYLRMHTNGGARKAEWWDRLAKIICYKGRGEVTFSVDGLEDTNHLYRRQTRWDVIMENAEAFISAGGRARWDFIVFKHNQHQVEEAETLAKKMGFKQFRIRKTARFSYSPAGPDKWPVYDRTPFGTPQTFAYHIEPTDDEKYYNTEIDKFELLKEKYGSAEKYFDVANISCLYKEKFKRIYVNAYGQVFPCCYISNDVYPGKNSIVRDTTEKLFNKYSTEFNNLKNNSWDSILNHEWFASKLEESWNTNLEGGKLMRCSRTCGNEYSPIMSQSKDTIL